MSLKGRVKFVVAGNHPLLYKVRDRLIQTGYALVPWNERPDFCLFGAHYGGNDLHDEVVALTHQSKAVCEVRIPTILLVDGTSKEDSDENTVGTLLTRMFKKNVRTGVLSTLDVYGPDIRNHIIDSCISCVIQNNSSMLPASIHNVRSFVYQDDFYKYIDVFVGKFSKGKLSGSFVLGHADNSKVKWIVDSMNSMIHGLEEPPDVVEGPSINDVYMEPAAVKKNTLKLAWSANVSLRRGLWLMSKSK